MSQHKCSILSFSGGMDSTSLLLNLLSQNHKVYAVSFKYGQKHGVEVDFAKKNISYLKNNGFILFYICGIDTGSYIPISYHC